MRPYTRSEEHVGEWKVNLFADSSEEIIAEATRVISRQCGPTAGRWSEWEYLNIEADDYGTMLVDWLNELLGLSEINNIAYSQTRNFRFQNGRVTGEVRGKNVTDWRSPLKAATYHGLEFKQHKNRWKAVVVFDI